MIVGLASEGATIQKGTLRISGAVVGAALGFLAILAFVPHMESITSLVLLVAGGTAVAAWVYLGSARISYVGVQIALAFYICVIQGFEPSWYFYTIRDRMIGILFGNLVITLVFLSVWPVRAAAAVSRSLASALRAMAELARVGGRSEDQAIVASAVHELRVQAYRHFAAAEQSLEEEAFEWFPPAPADAAARERQLAFATEARAVFLLQLAIASQRPNVDPADLPAALLASTRAFDAAVGESLELVADRAQSGRARDLPDLRARLETLAAPVEGEPPPGLDATVAVHVAGRHALYRELVPRLERLASLGPVA